MVWESEPDFQKNKLKVLAEKVDTNVERRTRVRKVDKDTSFEGKK